MGRASHWQSVYSAMPPQDLGWYTPHLDESLELIERTGITPVDPILDVGGGASTLADDLLARGFRDITVLDLSENALAIARERLGTRAHRVHWIAGDITSTPLPRAHYRLWHDRAVFHFLTEPRDRARYREQMQHALAAGGYAVIGTFAPQAPPRCSGLPVERYDAARLHRELDDTLELVQEKRSLHVTPGGVEQHYLHCLFRRL